MIHDQAYINLLRRDLAHTTKSYKCYIMLLPGLSYITESFT